MQKLTVEIDKLHGDETALVNAAISEGLVPPDGLEGRFAQDELAKEIRNIAAMMDIPDWLKEEDLAKQWCASHLASFKIPKYYFFESIPRTSTGKIQKYILREKAKNLLSK